MISSVKKCVRNLVFWLKRLRNPFKAVKDFIQFFRQWHAYKKNTIEPVTIGDWLPYLDDATKITPIDTHYFYQSAWATNKILNHQTDCHVDIGSQTDFIASLSAFVNVEFVDIRVLKVQLPRLKCIKGSVTSLPYRDRSIKSLSCLHVIEHIGLGRYGDEIDPNGAIKGCKEIQRVIRKNGNLYLTVPIGKERVCFNAHRIFNPWTIIKLFNELKLVDYGCVDDSGEYLPKYNIDDCVSFSYGLGLFHFRRYS